MNNFIDEESIIENLNYNNIKNNKNTWKNIFFVIFIKISILFLILCLMTIILYFLCLYCNNEIFCLLKIFFGWCVIYCIVLWILVGGIVGILYLFKK